MRAKTISMLLVLILLCAITGCDNNAAKDTYSVTDTLLDTVVTVTVYEGGNDNVLQNALEMCRDYEKKFSRTYELSEIYKMNKASTDSDLPLSDFVVTEETAELIRRSLDYSQMTDGAFDISIAPVSKLWDFKADNPKVPREKDIADALEKVGYNGVKIEGDCVSFDKAGMEIDLGGIAKGYIADKLREYLESEGVTSAVISLGGNVLCIGDKPDGDKFKIGIMKPFTDNSETSEILEIDDMSVVTSGVYERCFELDGRLYHHLLDTKTGYPTDNSLLAVTVVGSSSAACDALSTSLFCLGEEAGMKLVNGIDGYYALMITKDYEIVYSDGFKENIDIIG